MPFKDSLKMKIGYPKFKSKHHSKKSYTTNMVNGNIRLLANTIRLPKLGSIKIKDIEKHQKHGTKVSHC